VSSAPPSGGSRALARDPARHAPVGYMELFFDLVYVFAVTQVSHHLIAHLDWRGALQTLVLFLAVWWAWIYTTWATNWIDPDCAENRLMLGAIMIGSLVMSCTLTDAFGDYGLAFAIAYVSVQVGRSVYASWATGEFQSGARKTLRRVTVWFAVSGVLWITGGLAETPEARLAWWIGALTIEFLGPLCHFYLPGMGRFDPHEWNISGSHMAERCALFIIIALGEGVIITGATFAGLEPSPATIAAFLVAFLGSFAMWWVYFDVGAKRGAEHIEHHDAPGLVGRSVFTYWHIPIIAGIVLVAVADELTLAHPLEPVHADFLLVAVGGMALFLVGTMTFKRISNENGLFPLSHVIGLVLTAPLTVWGWLAHPLTLAFYGGVVAIFAIVALWEWISFHGGWIERIERIERLSPAIARPMQRFGEWRIERAKRPPS
jgi:low temperature requirement protein LtrA